MSNVDYFVRVTYFLQVFAVLVNLRDNKIEVGTFKYQFLCSKSSINVLIWYCIKVDKKTMYKR